MKERGLSNVKRQGLSSVVGVMILVLLSIVGFAVLYFAFTNLFNDNADDIGDSNELIGIGEGNVCVDDDDCLANQYCSGNTCVYGSGDRCDSNSDCDSGEVCSSEQCISIYSYNRGGGSGSSGNGDDGGNDDNPSPSLNCFNSDDTNLDFHPICTCDDLQRVNENLDWNYKLSNDIDCSDTVNWNDGKGFVPLGLTSGFNGDFDGKGSVVRNLNINLPDGENVGFFSILNGKVSDIGLENVNVTGYRYIGGLTGKNNGIVTKSYSSGSVAGNGYVGGLAGNIDSGTISNVYSNVSVRGNFNVGGLVGYSKVDIKNSYSSGMISCGANPNFIGGLVGYLYNAEISNSFSVSEIDCFALPYNVRGGLLGYHSGGDVVNSFWSSSEISCSGSFMGCTKIFDLSGNANVYFYDKTHAPYETWSDIIWSWSGSDYPKFDDLSSNVVLHYAFENNLEDSSGNGHDGFCDDKIGNCPSYSSSFDGTLSGDFDGVDDVVEPIAISDNLFINDYSISGIFSNDGWTLTEENISQALIQKRGTSNLLFGLWSLSQFSYPGCSYEDVYHKLGFMFGTHTTNGGNCEHWVFSNDEILPNVWHEFVLTYDSSTGEGKLYLDGVLQGSDIASTASTPMTYNLAIGGQPSDTPTGWRWFDGKIDDLIIYDKVLSQEEVSEVYGIIEGTDKVPPCGDYGDVNDDGFVSDIDANMILEFITGISTPTQEQEENGDVSNDGQLTAFDSSLIFRYTLGLESTFPVCSAVCPVGQSLGCENGFQEVSSSVGVPSLWYTQQNCVGASYILSFESPITSNGRVVCRTNVPQSARFISHMQGNSCSNFANTAPGGYEIRELSCV